MIGMLRPESWRLNQSSNKKGVAQNSGHFFGGTYNKGYSILESILGSRYLGKLPDQQTAEDPQAKHVSGEQQGIEQQAGHTDPVSNHCCF